MRPTLIACTGILLAGCQNTDTATDTGSGSDVALTSVHVTGTLSEALLANRRGLESPVDRVVALPGDVGQFEDTTVLQAVVFDLGADGTFDIELSTDSRWVLLLESTTAPTRLERIQGYITVNSGEESMLQFPIDAAEGDIDLGEIEPGDDGNASAEATVDDLTGAFGLSPEELALIAATDGIFSLLGNAWVNYDPETGKRWSTTANMHYTTSIERFGHPDASPGDFFPRGVGVFLGTNDDAFDYGSLCVGDEALTVIPATSVSTLNGRYFGQNTPFSMVDAELRQDTQGVCASGDILLKTTDGLIEIGVPADDTLVKTWNTSVAVDIDGVDHASFNLHATVAPSITSAGMPVPVVTPTLDGDQITAIDVAFYAWGNQQWTELTDELVVHVLDSVGLDVGDRNFNLIEDGEFHSQIIPADIGISWTLSDLSWVVVGTKMGPGNFFFEYTGEAFCGNNAVDEGEQCDRDDLNGDTCSDIGYGGGTLYCGGNCRWNTRVCQPGVDGEWSEQTPPAVAAVNASLLLLDEDTVFVAGGVVDGVDTATTQLFDLETGTWSTAGDMLLARREPVLTLLEDGRVMVSGAGTGSPTIPASTSVEIFDPETLMWNSTGSLAVARKDHSATLLHAGRVLVAGGGPVNDLGASELWTPFDGTFSDVDDMPQPREQHGALSMGTWAFFFGGYEDERDLGGLRPAWYATETGWDVMAEDTGIVRWFRPRMYTDSAADLAQVLIVDGTCFRLRPNWPGPCKLLQFTVWNQTYHSTPPAPREPFYPTSAALLEPGGPYMLVSGTRSFQWHPDIMTWATDGPDTPWDVPQACSNGDLVAIGDGQAFLYSGDGACIFSE